jgi:hypothetical protein
MCGFGVIMNWFVTQLRHDWQRYDALEQWILSFALTASTLTIFIAIRLASH